MKLKPCPFCGGEASKRLFYKGKYRVHCNVCDAHSGDVCDTEAEAIAAWNSRAERTCRIVNHGGIGGSVPLFTCGECDSLFYGNAYGEAPNYCPNCGAKVVGE